MTKEAIWKVVLDRDSICKKDPNNKKVDHLRNGIIRELKKEFNNLPIDFVLESITHLGYAPNLVYDDNGRFAVSGDGYNQVVTGNEKIEGSMMVAVEKSMWKKTIRGAVKDYLNRFEPIPIP